MLRPRPIQHPIFIEEESLIRRPRKKLRLRFVLALVVTVTFATWYSQRARAEGVMPNQATPGQATPDQVTPDQVTPDQVETGQLLLTPREGGAATTALLQDSVVHIEVSGMVAHVSLEQRFRNDSQQWVEGVYAFPLPDKAAVNHMRMVIGERVIEGRIKERAEAQKIYQKAKAEGKRASLVKQQRPNLFTTKVANIGPYETVKVQLEYVQTVAYDHGLFSLRFPMTITPRYIPGVPLRETAQAAGAGEEKEQPRDLVTDALGWARGTDQVPDAAEITPFLNPALPSEGKLINPIELTARLDMGMPLQVIDSAYHNIIVSRDDNRYRIRLREGRVSMDQDFELSWRPRVGESPRAALFSEAVDGEDYGLLMVIPPDRKAVRLPKEVVYVIDTSGSMGGVSIRQARDSLLYALRQLAPDDRFNVISFNSSTDVMFPHAVAASSDNLNAAARYVGNLQAGGGTEMLSAVNAALRDSADEGYVRQVIFITDGAVGNEQALFGAIHRQLGASRLFTVGIGSAPNSHFMRKAAQFGRGTFTYIGKVQEVEEKMKQLLGKLNSPVATNIQLQWPGHHVVESYPKRIPDLYNGEPLLVTAKLHALKGDIVVSGQLAGDGWQQRIHVDGPQHHSGVATLWAREKIADLLDAKTAGADADKTRQAVLDVALTHQLVSPYTSFVAVEETPARPVHESLATKPVANARPRGQSPQTFAYPRTATGATVSFYWGAAFIAMFLVLRFVIEREERYGLVD